MWASQGKTPLPLILSVSEENGKVGFLQGLEGEKFILIIELQRHLLSLPSTLWTIPSASPDPCPASFSAGQPRGLLETRLLPAHMQGRMGGTEGQWVLGQEG